MKLSVWVCMCERDRGRETDTHTHTHTQSKRACKLKVILDVRQSQVTTLRRRLLSRDLKWPRHQSGEIKGRAFQYKEQQVQRQRGRN